MTFFHQSLHFAFGYYLRFITLTKGYTHAEIPLFKAMLSALNGHGKMRVESYHGGSHQVTFTGNGTFARKFARCELSDLMIISYSTNPTQIRVTFLQAKSERGAVPHNCSYRFSANLEQWYLLALRPQIKGCGSFNPPADLLSKAILSSIGSFGFFYKDSAGNFQVHYASADYLKVPKHSTKKNGKLTSQGTYLTVHSKGYRECLSATDNFEFANSLYNLEIGTPLETNSPQTSDTRIWLADVLRGIIQNADFENEKGLVKELLSLLNVEGDGIENSFGAKSLLVLKSIKHIE